MVHRVLRRAAAVFGPALTALCFCAPLGMPAAAQTLAAAPAIANPADTMPASGIAARTRFVVGLDHAVEFQVFSLNNPNRVVVELPDVHLALPDQPTGAAAALVHSFRGGQSGPGRARIVIDVSQPVVVENAHFEHGTDGRSQRLALDIVPVETPSRKSTFKVAPSGLGAGALASATPVSLQPPLPKPAIAPQVRAGKAFKPIIVIDPGHGGHDSGAQKNGTVEKDVVLAFSKVLRDHINATGQYKVIMTRDSDVFVELDERRAFAERANASLFIAVHADYAQSRAKGATIFSLRESVADELRRSAKSKAGEGVLSPKEIKAVESAGDVDAVKGILSDLASREFEANKERTNIFAHAVIETMGTSTDLRENPDQQAAFRVLKTAQFPSVLIELGYVTNSEDARQLKSDAWREKVADSITEAVNNYFSNQVAHMPM
jgi:N-acetylmuramoyl-L-alanine amidase